MFLREGMAFGPIVAVDRTHVTIQLYTPYERDGELLKIELAKLTPQALSEVEIARQLLSL